MEGKYNDLEKRTTTTTTTDKKDLILQAVFEISRLTSELRKDMTEMLRQTRELIEKRKFTTTNTGEPDKKEPISLLSKSEQATGASQYSIKQPWRYA